MDPQQGGDCHQSAVRRVYSGQYKLSVGQMLAPQAAVASRPSPLVPLVAWSPNSSASSRAPAAVIQDLRATVMRPPPLKPLRLIPLLLNTMPDYPTLDQFEDE